MCYKVKKTAKAAELEARFGAKVADSTVIEPVAEMNGFDHPQLPVITNAVPGLIQQFQWGLIPAWAKDAAIQKSTLNARIETVRDLPSFRDAVQQKCMILVNGFYEWKWLDEKGKQKEKYLIAMPDDAPFAMAGLWSAWKDPEGIIVNTCTIITTEAQGIMREIHNSKLRMPVILKPEIERAWLMGETKGKLHTDLVAIMV